MQTTTTIFLLKTNFKKKNTSPQKIKGTQYRYNSDEIFLNRTILLMENLMNDKHCQNNLLQEIKNENYPLDDIQHLVER